MPYADPGASSYAAKVSSRPTHHPEDRMNTMTASEADNRRSSQRLTSEIAGTPELVAVRERIKEIRQGTDTVLGQLCDLHMRLHGHHPIPPQPMQESAGSKADSSAGEISNLHDELSRAINNVDNLRICAEKLEQLA